MQIILLFIPLKVNSDFVEIEMKVKNKINWSLSPFFRKEGDNYHLLLCSELTILVHCFKSIIPQNQNFTEQGGLETYPFFLK